MIQLLPNLLWFICLILVMDSIRKLKARVRTLELERAINQREFFLRDDLPIRRNAEHDKTFDGREQAYSLFSRSPYERHAVYAGPLPWAVEQAHKQVMEQT